MLDTAKEKVLDTGAAVADKVADKTFDLAEKADDLKGKMHTIAADAKKMKQILVNQLRTLECF